MVWIGALALALSFWGLFADVGFIAQPFYAYAWWSYILLLDGFVYRRRLSSLLTTRRRHLPGILLWSVTFWFVFELLNLRYQNWYYVGVFDVNESLDLVKGAVFGVVCFATVFTGLFETYDALATLGLFSRARISPRRLPPWTSYAVQGLGGLMVTLSLAFADYLAPLVWGSLTFLVDPWNYRRGARSLLADVEAGRVDVLLRLLTAGLACGLIWESFNFYAPQKWIYTVRGLEELKLFEMPLLGFLGFPALALDAFAAYAAISYLMYGNTTWEHPGDVSQRLGSRRALTRSRRVALVPLHVVFWAGVGIAGQTTNIGSVELGLRHLESLPPDGARVLESEGLERPRQLLRAARIPERAEQLRHRLSMTRAGFASLLDEARLFELKGIGYHHGALLRRLGIGRVEDLAQADPDELYERLEAMRQVPFPALRPEMVRVWVQGASSSR